MAKRIFVTKASFATQIDVSRTRVSQLVRAGLPVGDDGLIDLAKGKSWYQRHIDHNRREARKPSKNDSRGCSATENRNTKLGWEARIRELEFKKESGSVIDRGAVERFLFERARAERDRWIGAIPRVTARLAEELDLDPKELFPAIDRAVRDLLTETAATPLGSLANVR